MVSVVEHLECHHVEEWQNIAECFVQGPVQSLALMGLWQVRQDELKAGADRRSTTSVQKALRLSEHLIKALATYDAQTSGSTAKVGVDPLSRPSDVLGVGAFEDLDSLFNPFSHNFSDSP